MIVHRPIVPNPKVLAVAAAAFLGAAAPAGAFELIGPGIEAGAPIAQTFAFDGFGCTGDNISPAMTWSDPPEGTEGYALMVHDADAATGGAGFWHWVVLDIPADASSIERGAGTEDGRDLPAGARQVRTDFGVPGWGGPCPPAADAAHTYTFTLYALPVAKLDVPADATASFAGFVVNGTALGSASFEATYDR